MVLANGVSGVGTSIAGGGTARVLVGIKTDVNASVSIGFNCAPALATGQSNTMLGYNAAAQSTAGEGNCVFGYGAAVVCGGTLNMYFGTSVTPQVTNATRNIVVGCEAGRSLLSGCGNLVVGTYADTINGYTSNAVALGGDAAASSRATCVGQAASADGACSVALGNAVHVVGDGCFSLADRLRGRFLLNNPGGADVYAVEVDADVLQLASGGALMWCAADVGAANGAGRSNATPAWAMQLGGARDSNADLVMTSAAGASIRFGNEFVPGVLDFTAQHSCPLRTPPSGGAASAVRPGLLVVATGEYARPVTADDAVPCVALSTRAGDPRVFGVVAEEQRPCGVYRVGNLTFEARERRLAGAEGEGGRWVTVNAAGEGGIWVCDEGGPLRNGDLLVSASLAPGMAMRQPGAQLVGPATAAKATCDCRFDEPDAVPVPGGRARLVGCVYKF